MAHIRPNHQQGSLGASLTAPAAGTSQAITGLFATPAPNFDTLATGDYITIVLDGGEISYLTVYTSGSLDGTLTRGAEDAVKFPPTTHTASTGKWSCNPTANDFTTFTYVPRTGTATLGANEITEYTSAGATGQALALPSSPPAGTLNFITNNSGYPVTVTATGTIDNYGSSLFYGVGFVVIQPGTSVALVHAGSNAWTVVDSNLTGFTQPPLDDSTNIATTAYADTAVSVETTRAEAAEALLVTGGVDVSVGGLLSTTANVEAVIDSRSPNQLAAISGNLNFGGFKAVGLADGAASGEAVAFDQLSGLAPSGVDISTTGALLPTTNVDTVARAAAYQDITERGGSAGSSVVAIGNLSNGSRLGIHDAVIGDSEAYGTGALPGLTDWASHIAQTESRSLGLPEPGIGFVHANVFSDLTGGAAAPSAISITSVGLSTTTTVTATNFTGIVPGMGVTVSSGTGTLTTGTYVVSVSGGSCVLNQIPATTGTATLSFETSPRSGLAVYATAWVLNGSGQAIGDGISKAGAAITVASVTTTVGSTSATASSFPLVVQGMLVTGPGIPYETYVRSIAGGTTLTLTKAATAAGAVTLSFKRVFRHAVIWYQKVNNGDNVVFTNSSPLGVTTSASLSTHSPTGGIGYYDTGDAFTAALGGGGITATQQATATSGAGGGGVTILGVSYYGSILGVSVDNFAYPSTFASSHAAVLHNGVYIGWAAALATRYARGNPYRRLYVMCGTNDASFYGTPSGVQTAYTSIATIANAVSPSTEVVLIAQPYGATLTTFASTSTVSGSAIVASPNFTTGGFGSPNIFSSNSRLIGTGLPVGAQLLSIAGVAVYTGSTGSSVSGSTITGTGFTSAMTGMLATSAGTGVLAAGTIVTYVSATSLSLNHAATTNGSISTLTLTPTVTLSATATATGTVTAYLQDDRQGAALWGSAFVPGMAAAATATGSTFINLYEAIGDYSLRSTVASTITTSGSATATVSSGGFPGVLVGQLIQGPGIALDTLVRNVSGNTLTMTIPATATGTMSLNFFNGTWGLSFEGLHPGDNVSTISGRSGTRAIAEHIYKHLAFSSNLPEYATFQTSSPADGRVTALTPTNLAGNGVAWEGFADARDSYPVWSVRSGAFSNAGMYLGPGGASTFDTRVTRTFPGVVAINNALSIWPVVTVVSANAGTIAINAQNATFTNSSAAAMTITLTTTSVTDGQTKIVRIYDYTGGASQSITWVGTENSSVTVPATSAGSVSIPKVVGFIFNAVTSNWTCVAAV